MLYKAYLEQSNVSDSYIASGKICIDIIASSLEEAALKLKEIIISRYSYNPYKIDSCQLFEVENVINIDLNKIFTDLHNQQMEYEYVKYNSKKEELIF